MRPKKFIPEPFEYHQEIELTIDTLTSRGHGLGRIDGWVVMVPFALPGEKVRARVFRNYKNYSEADLMEVIEASKDRVEPKCPLFGRCGGCQYQNLSYEAQLEWKRQQVQELLKLNAGIENFPVEPTHPSPKQYGYRSKLTPHYPRPRADEDLPLGFLECGKRNSLVDVEQCPIASEGINAGLPKVRQELNKRAHTLKRAGTLLLRDTPKGLITNPKATATEKVGEFEFQFIAGEFFQNNPFILPEMVEYVLEKAKDSKYLLDTYCGVGLFSICAHKRFERCMGVEVSEIAIELALKNKELNKAQNCEFIAGKSEAIFAHVDFPAEETTVIIDPPRKGCDEAFLEQLVAMSPSRLVYVSCDPATQARDVGYLENCGYALESIRPFDLFPQTRHIESVAVLVRK